MSPIGIASGLLIGLLAFWLLGGLVARVGGLLLILAGTANLVLEPRAAAALLIAVGAAIWLFGYWHYALRHHAYKSPLARYVFSCWAPAWLDPTRNWTEAAVSDRLGRASRAREPVKGETEWRTACPGARPGGRD